MAPATGERRLRFLGDRVQFELRFDSGRPLPEGWRGYVRTNLGRAVVRRQQIIHAHSGRLKLVDASWRDLRMNAEGTRWTLDLPLTEAGYFQAKAYAVDASGWQHWPEGPDVGLSVHPDAVRAGNTLYCAFVRMFGPTRTAQRVDDKAVALPMAELDRRGYTVIPPSGRLRDLVRLLPHIFDTLGCRILHLLPVHPTPTVYARFGRFGSPYAAQDLTAVDPALVEFDRRTTGVDQFRELTYAAHCRGGRVFLDIVTNHTGWGARLQEAHPEWYVRGPDGAFASPGAWGTTWEDLVELDQNQPALWEKISAILLTWCRRGVDGFRCDAGYKIPLPAWQYITARVLDEFPETIFLLEGLGGSWEATEALLTEGSMQWAYSELFQNYSGQDVAHYLDYSLRQSGRVGLYVHYSETHDNPRLAEKGRAWSLLRNQLCALTSVSGGYGFTAGVEWLATDRLRVHESRGLAWGNPFNLVPELAALNRLLAEHPCFLDGAKLQRLSADNAPVYALSRLSAEGLDFLLVLANTDEKRVQTFELSETEYRDMGQPGFDWLTRQTVRPQPSDDGKVRFELPPATCRCLGISPNIQGLGGAAYRRARAQAAWALTALSRQLDTDQIGPFDWRALAARVDADPAALLTAIPNLDARLARQDLLRALEHAAAAQPFPALVRWQWTDARRVTPVPPGHALLLEDSVPFRATLTLDGHAHHEPSIEVRAGHVACFPAQDQARAGSAELSLERYDGHAAPVRAALRFLAPDPDLNTLAIRRDFHTDAPTMARAPGHVLLTNGIGGMARLPVDLGTTLSKYDCVLGANLHPSVPVDRHLFVKRIRAWVVADGFISPLNDDSLIRFCPGPPSHWVFAAGAGDGRTVEIHLTADMLPQSNTTVLRFARPAAAPCFGRDLPAGRQVSLTVRPDILDRSFHTETRRTPETEQHFASHCHPLAGHIGFAFAPAADRQLHVFSDTGAYHHQQEWSMHIDHPVERSRGQTDHEDAYSPGWFDLPMPKGARATLTLSADWDETVLETVPQFDTLRHQANEHALARAQLPPDDAFGRQLALAVHAFLARRGAGKTIIAGYPWFLDWGRDSLIAARGLLAAGMTDEVRQLLQVFGRFEKHGTLPNTIHGEDASNRETSDAPLWYGLVCDDTARLSRAGDLYALPVNRAGRTMADVLQSIAAHYLRGTPNGIRVDPASGLVFSPTHFTWMDTNHPAGTPRQGYPVEVQVLWIALLRQLARLQTPTPAEPWNDLAARALDSVERLFWLDGPGYLADVLPAQPGQPAALAAPDTALRSNGLLAVSLGLLTGERARRCVLAAQHHLIVPGALRSLAPLPVSPPLPIHAPDGRLLNDPDRPYQGRYEGDEDTRRKPAYHNGTAWTWTLPAFCEALARAWDFTPQARAAARAYLGSLDQLLAEGCRGQIPEILDGDAPHTQRGCDAQAWSATEALRVWKLLNQPPTPDTAAD